MTQQKKPAKAPATISLFQILRWIVRMSFTARQPV